ncbi:hypothetical protein [Streptomyces hokutonensis]|uniref:hypothetical protein n=1 Tax=Streptomyces hokutonensis TaxID=1306990 RepID=UPI00382B8CB9
MTDTRFTVLDETQRHPDLVKWISLILRQVASTVNEITGLPLPPEVRFRLHGGSLVDEAALHQLLIHELVQKRGITTPGVTTVLEGHAAWADHQVTTRLLGAPADHRAAPKSLRYRLQNALPGIRRLGPSRAAYEQGCRLITEAVTEGSTDLVNQVLKDVTYLPTEAQIADPASWIHRIERGLPSA